MFCSRVCSAIYNNKNRVRTELQNKRTSDSLKVYFSDKRVEKQKFLEEFVGPFYKKVKVKTSKPESNKIEIVGEYSKIYFCKCKFCKSIFTKNTVKQICDQCKIIQKKLYVDYRFTFNVYEYPELFDLVSLKEHGWYSPGGKSGKWNPTGFSRDHKISVSEAVKNHYDPFYITHQLNCELIPHSNNSKKRHRSSITYAELVKAVNEYEKWRGSDSN